MDNVFIAMVTIYRKTFIVALFALLFAGAGRAQQSIRLTDHWEFLRQDLGGPWEAVRPASVSAVPVWQPVRLPHCVNATDAVDPNGNYYRGPAWYRTQLMIANPYTGGRTLLHFEGAGQKTAVYIYTTRVETHTGGYDEWTVDVTDAVAAFAKTDICRQQFKGQIPLVIRTDNSRDPEMIPSDLSDFSIYGGLYRYVNLVYEPAVSIDRLLIDAQTDEMGSKGTIGIKTLLYDPGRGEGADDGSQVGMRARTNGRGEGESVRKPEGVSFALRLWGPDGKLLRQTPFTAATSAADTFRLADLSVRRPVLWGPDHPALYTVELTVKGANGDSCVQREQIGFRHFTFVDNGPFLLNGQRLLLRGTHRHEDHAGLGAAMTEDLMRQEMVLIKEMGVNFIRLAHYQQSPIILHLCDSLGILVWEEIPWCRGGLGGAVYQEQARRMLTHMISQHYDHPAVIIWGLGNENDWPGDFPEFDKEKIHAFMATLNSLAHRLDPSRKTAIRRCDFCADIPDVYSPSIWAGWYRGAYTEYKQSSEEAFKKVKHFLHVEWGGDSHARRHSENPDEGLVDIPTGSGTDERTGDASRYGGVARVSKDGDWSESYICNLIDWHLKEQETMPWLTGSAQWVFKDFSTPSRPDNPVPFVNQKGVVERDLTKKESYYVFQSYWTTRLMAHIYGHTWPIRWGKEGEGRLVKVYSNGEDATLFLNGVNCGLRHRNSQDFPAAGLRWKVTFRKGENELRVVARKGNAVVEDTIHLFYQTEQWGKPVRAVLEKVAITNDTATIRVRLLDDKGVLCLDAADWIRFGLTGDGRLLDDLGTSTGSRYVQAYNGQAQIRVALQGGASVISVQAGTMPTTFLSLGGEGNGGMTGVVARVLKKDIMAEADRALQQAPITVTDSFCVRSAGGRHDFYSEGDYWWPNPVSVDSPYIQRDGMSNPANFTAHRLAMIRFSRIVGALASAYRLTGNPVYVRQALMHCKAWFVDTTTYMTPALTFAQAIKGRATGRGIGIIDTIQLMEVVEGLEAMASSDAMDAALLARIKAWFRRYLQWLTTHPYGRDEMNAANNHGTCWVMQVSAFARFTGDTALMRFCRERYKTVLLPRQMAADGSFPLELKRTKPYSYSLFNLDAMTTICQLLSIPEDDLWHYTTEDGRNIEKGIAFLYPFIADKSKWPYAHDVMYWNEWPVASPALVFGAMAFHYDDWLRTWDALSHAPDNEEVIRNLPVRHPLIWLR